MILPLQGLVQLHTVSESQSRHEPGWNVRRLHAERFAVRQPKPSNRQDRAIGWKPQGVCYAEFPRLLDLRQDPRCRLEAMAAHFLGKTGKFARTFVEFTPGDEGTPPLFAPYVALLG